MGSPEKGAALPNHRRNGPQSSPKTALHSFLAKYEYLLLVAGYVGGKRHIGHYCSI
jgi:hypothetical protein